MIRLGVQYVTPQGMLTKAGYDALLAIETTPGPQGAAGTDGTDGADGINGADGADGAPGPAGTTYKGAVTVTVPLGSYTHRETVAALGVTPASLIGLSLGVFADTDENAAEFLDIAAMSAAAGTDQITITMAFGTPTSGLIRLNWSAL